MTGSPDGDGRGLAIAGDYLFAAHDNGPGAAHDVDILRIAEDAEKQALQRVGSIPAAPTASARPA